MKHIFDIISTCEQNVDDENHNFNSGIKSFAFKHFEVSFMFEIFYMSAANGPLKVLKMRLSMFCSIQFAKPFWCGMEIIEWNSKDHLRRKKHFFSDSSLLKLIKSDPKLQILTVGTMLRFWLRPTSEFIGSGFVGSVGGSGDFGVHVRV